MVARNRSEHTPASTKHSQYFAKDDTVRWKVIPDFPAYKISDNGQVLSFKQRREGKLLRPGDAGGHLICVLRRDGKSNTVLVSHLVATAFIGPRPSMKHGVLHKDDNFTHNYYSNLYWGTQKENWVDAVRNGIDSRGSKNGAASLTKEQVLQIKKLLRTGNGELVARMFGVTGATISRIKNRITYHDC